MIGDWLKKVVEKERFAALVTEKLRSAGVEEEIAVDVELFRLTLGHGARQVFLDNHYAEFCASPPWKRPLVLERVVGAITAVHAPRPKDFAAVRRDLFPVIRDPWVFDAPRIVAELEGNDPWKVACRAITDDYCVALVVDSDTAMSFVSEEELRDFGVPFERALEYAQDNLAGCSLPPRFQQIRRGVHVSDWRDNYDASRILFPELIGALVVHGRPVVAMPSRDMLVVTGDEDEAGWRTLVEVVTAEVQRPRPLGAVPLVWSEGGWSTFRPKGDGAAAIAVRNLVTQARGWTYADQKKLLEQREARTDGGTFIASFSGLTPPDSGEIVSFATWTRGVPALLPRTTEIALVDTERPEPRRLIGLFPWDKVAEIAGSLMTPEGLRPERWRVNGFPDARMLALLDAHRRR